MATQQWRISWGHNSLALFPGVANTDKCEGLGKFPQVSMM